MWHLHVAVTSLTPSYILLCWHINWAVSQLLVKVKRTPQIEVTSAPSRPLFSTNTSTPSYSQKYISYTAKIRFLRIPPQNQSRPACVCDLIVCVFPAYSEASECHILVLASQWFAGGCHGVRQQEKLGREGKSAAQFCYPAQSERLLECLRNDTLRPLLPPGLSSPFCLRTASVTPPLPVAINHSESRFSETLSLYTHKFPSASWSCMHTDTPISQ